MRDGSRAWRVLRVVALLGSLGGTAFAQGPADDLLRLTPADAGVTLAVEDLSGQLKTVLDSPLAEGLGNLPAVRAWLGSDGPRRLERARKEIGAALKVDPARARDALLGEAFVLALHVPPKGTLEQARGLLLTKVRDRDLLLRLIEVLNDAERKAGTLVDVSVKTRGESSYSVRTFRAGTKGPEAYAILGDTFAWSNSEALIQGVIDRRGPGRGDGLGDLPAFRKVRKGLPARSAASLFVDPKFADRVLAAGQGPRTPQDERVVEALRGRLATLEYAGAGLRWQDGPIVHLHEVYLPAGEGLSPRRSSSPTPRAPATALAVATVSVDFPKVYDALWCLVPDADRPRAEHVAAVLRGISLGKDARAEVLPKLGPGVLAYVETPLEGEAWPPWVATVEVTDHETALAIENALRTALSVYALANEAKGRALKVEAREEGGVRFAGLVGARFAYAVGRGRLSIGATPEAAAGGLAAVPSEVGNASHFDRARASHFAGASAFAYIDLEAAWKVADSRRDALARGLATGRGGRAEDARRDLDQVLDLLGLFRFAFVAAEGDPGPSVAHQSFGLISRGGPSPTP